MKYKSHGNKGRKNILKFLNKKSGLKYLFKTGIKFMVCVVLINF